SLDRVVGKQRGHRDFRGLPPFYAPLTPCRDDGLVTRGALFGHLSSRELETLCGAKTFRTSSRNGASVGSQSTSSRVSGVSQRSARCSTRRGSPRRSSAVHRHRTA